jgi:hypothetical protein
MMENKMIENSSEIMSKLPSGNDILLKSEIMDKIIVEIYNGWPGETGLSRVINAVNFIFDMIPQYAQVMGKSELETLELIAKARNVNYVNYFQNANFPDLMGVYVFDSNESFLSEFPSKKFLCPCCGGISTDPQKCDSGKKMSKKEICNWKSYGLFGTLGKGIHVVFKDKFEITPKPVEIFKPIELLEIEV